MGNTGQRGIGLRTLARNAVLVCLLGCLLVGPIVVGNLPEAEKVMDVPIEIQGPATPSPVDLPQIIARGKLTALTTYSATNYFIYKGRPMGYEYELLASLADHLDVSLEIVVADDIDGILDELLEGKGDMVAYAMAVTSDRLKDVAFTRRYAMTRQVLVQRKPANWREMKIHEIEDQLIRYQFDLIGKTVHVRPGSSYYARLTSLSDEIGGKINVVEAASDVSTETLIRMVATGEIDYTIADENVALVARNFAPILDVATPVSFPQRIAWAVRKESKLLLHTVNQWLEDVNRNGTNKILYDKYFNEPRNYKESVGGHFQESLKGDGISDYDDLFRRASERIGWDWRLVASLAYQESQFDPEAKSWAGAMGLMQVMPRTGRAHGATDLFDPEENVQAGVDYLGWLDQQWSVITNPDERVKFVLASFNAGKGHVDDARRLAHRYGVNPNLWEGNVVQYLVALSQPEFFNDAAVRFGYCQGESVASYVREVLARYNHYKNFVELAPADDRVAEAP